jgi:rhamnosyltransferase
METAQTRPWIVVPLFRPSPDVVGNLRHLAAEAPVVAVDDGSPSSFDVVLDEVRTLPGVELVRVPENRGIATALNRGVERAVELGCTVVVFFDQDSLPREGYVRTALELLDRCERRGRKAGAVGPARQNTVTPEAIKDIECDDRYTLIQSGMAVPVAAVRDVGLMDEPLVIDGVDTDFCLRLRRAGWRVAVSPRLVIEHRLGAGEENYRQLWLGPFRPTATFHSPDRRYYINRNLVHLLRRHAWSEPRWALLAVRRTMSNNLAAVVLEDRRMWKLTSSLVGLMHGAAGLYGPRRSPARLSAPLGSARTVGKPHRLRVADCTGQEFTAACRRLSEQVARDFRPDLVVGIERGGAIVAAALAESPALGVPVCTVRAQRSLTTSRSRSRAVHLAGRLPRGWADRLRIVEHHARSAWAARAGARHRPVTLDEDARPRIAAARRILVVDDAVDSGLTLREVTGRLRSMSDAEIRTAALTVTTDRPLVQPDFVLHRGVLLRFPWAADARR